MRCRASDTTLRKSVKPIDEMTPDELRIELREIRIKLRELRHDLRVDPITQIPNRWAWEEMEKEPAQAWIDADGPEWLADEHHRALCEPHLRAIAVALEDSMPGKVAYFYGDFFAAHARTPLDLEMGITRALRILSSARTQMTRPDGATTVLYGLGFSYGQASELRNAEFALQYLRKGAPETGFVLPANARLPVRLKPLIRAGYKLSQVRLTMPDGTIKDC